MTPMKAGIIPDFGVSTVISHLVKSNHFLRRNVNHITFSGADLY